MEQLTINKSRKTKKGKYRHKSEAKTGDLLKQNSQTPREDITLHQLRKELNILRKNSTKQP